ncbi:MAG: carbamoyltransferase C-terminal domain-containing protein [Bryobacteraceae bacterium]
MIILGLGGLLGDAASALLKDGKLQAAAEESKIFRAVRPGNIPQGSVDECLRIAHVRKEQVDVVAVARPFTRGPESQLHLALRTEFPNAEIAVFEHHRSHAASAFFASPFEEATVLTLDNAGDFRCGGLWKGSGGQLRLEREWYYPDSLGRLFGAVTTLLGFRPHAEEHKVQWLSTFGDDRFVGLFKEIISSSARLDPSFFDGNVTGEGVFGAKFYERVGLEPGATIPESMAASVAYGLQKAAEHTVIGLVGEGENLCLAGGLFLNALLVDALERSGNYKNVFVQGASGNAGTAIGAALHAWYQRNPLGPRYGYSLLLGPSYNPDEIKQVLENCKLRFKYVRSNDTLLHNAVSMLGERKIIAWMQGRMEFGARALGNRSILASPLDPYSTENLNVFIKHREPFRKFAASVPAEFASEYFDAGPNASQLATVGRVKAAHRKTFATAILGEDLVRVHTVSEEENPLYHRLLHEAGKATGLPVLYNTSFNLFGDPLVSTPRDAVRSFYSSGIDALFVGNFVLEK